MTEPSSRVWGYVSGATGSSNTPQPARGTRSSGRASPRTRDAPRRYSPGGRHLRTARPPHTHPQPKPTHGKGRGAALPAAPPAPPGPSMSPLSPPVAAPVPPRPSPQHRAAEGRAVAAGQGAERSGAERRGAAEGGRIVPPSRLGGTLNCSRRPPPAPQRYPRPRSRAGGGFRHHPGRGNGHGGEGTDGGVREVTVGYSSRGRSTAPTH